MNKHGRISIKLFIMMILLYFTGYVSALETSSKALNLLVEKAKKQFEVSSISLAVLPVNSHDVSTYVTGYVAMDSPTPITPDTLFKVGSIAKTYTADLIIHAINEHKLSLQTKIGQYLPQYPKWKNLTVAQLANQTSGIIDYNETPNWWHGLMTSNNKIWQTAELIQLSYNSKQLFKAGRGWGYSNTNYLLLGLILEKIYKQPIARQLNNLILQYSLKSTLYYPGDYTQEILARLTHGYFMNKYDETVLNESWLKNAGALLTTSSDMCLWMQIFLQQNKNFIDSLKFIDTNTGGNISKGTNVAYAFGLFKRNTPYGVIYFTPGLTSGYVSMMVYAPVQGVYFAYSASKSPIPEFHDFMLDKVLEVLSHQALKKSLNKVEN